MGTSIEDILYEESLYEDYLNEIRDNAIENSVRETIINYFNNNSKILVPTEAAIENAIKHLDFCPTSTIIYAGISQELMLKELLFKPIVFGLVNNEIASDIIITYVFNNKSPFAVKKINEVVCEYARVDFHSYKRPKSKKNIWEEMVNLSQQRNDAVHKGVQYNNQEAKFALSLVTDVYSLLTVDIFKALGVKLKK